MYGTLLSSHTMGMWVITSMGEMSPASTQMLQHNKGKHNPQKVMIDELRPQCVCCSTSEPPDMPKAGEAGFLSQHAAAAARDA
jgi:hypothetical protein